MKTLVPTVMMHFSKLSSLYKAFLYFLLILTTPSLQAQVFVDLTASGASDGTSWDDAYKDLQDALLATTSGEIWVAQGTYLPRFCNPCDMFDREAAFFLPDGVRLYGGFNGTEASLDQRDWNANPTILSGDIGIPGDSTDNVFKVLIAKSVSSDTRLDGFIVEEGNADGSFGFSSGGGLYIDAQMSQGNMIISNCTFRNNYAGGGGAIAIDCILGGTSKAIISNSYFVGNTASLQVVSSGAAIFMQGNGAARIEPQIINCVFENNFCGNDGGAISMTPTGVGTILGTLIDSCSFINNRATDRGAGIWYRMSNGGQTGVIIRNSQFSGNHSGGQGAAIFARSSFDNIGKDSILNCYFSQNIADGSSMQNDGEGGAIFIRGSQIGNRTQTIVNCVFDRNFAAHRGGAIGTTSIVTDPGICTTEIVNCTFYGNKTDGDGGAIHAEGTEGDNFMSIINSILWGDTAAVAEQEIFSNGANVTMSYTDLSGPIPAGVTDGGNNLDIDPMFVDAQNADYRLLSCSPLLDIGNNAALPGSATTDLDGDNRIHNDIVDLGAYEIGRIYVDWTATGANSGRSWADAYNDMQDALAAARGGDQIWVAQGIYKPTTCNPCMESDRMISFDIYPNTEIYGGFNATETELEQRDWLANPTILSGDIGAPIDSTDNAYTVLFAKNSTDKTILDGFIIEEGNADGSFGSSSGGGLLLDGENFGTANLQVRNCNFRNNYAGGGGGLSISCILGGTCEALIRDCTFEGNTASLQVVSTGAGIFMQGNGGAQITPKIINCLFENNFSGNDGGAISMTPTGQGTFLGTLIDSCQFLNNRARDRGGAVWYRMSNFGNMAVVIRNSQFTGNRGGGQGGAIFTRSSFDNIANDTIINCIFTQNIADGTSQQNDGEGGAIFIRGSQNGTINQQIINCVFDRNLADHRGGAIGTTSIVTSAGTNNTEIINCSFSGNKTNGAGGAIHANGTDGMNTMLVTNSILWGDTAVLTAQEILNNGADFTLSYSDLAGSMPFGLTDGGNNISVDPQYLAPEDGNLQVSACSPTINAGQNAALPPDLTDLDNDGNTSEAIDLDILGIDRIFQDIVDMGAYEWDGDPPLMTISLDSTAVSCSSVCDGSASVLPEGGVPGYDFLWSEGQTSASIDGLCPGTYYVTVSDAFQCVQIDSVTIAEIPTLELTTTADTSICAGSAVSLNAMGSGGNGDFTFSWDNGLGDGPVQEVMPDMTTTYSVTLTDANDCTASSSVNVEILPEPMPTIDGALGICTDSTTVLDAGTFDTYLWSTGEDTQQIEVAQGGMVGVTVTDADGCTGMAEVTIEEFLNPEAQISGSTTFCSGASTTLDAGAGFDQYLWSDGSMEQTVSINTPGDVGLTVTDANGCSANTMVSIVEADELMPAISGELSFCESNSTILEVGTFDTYLWSTGEDTQQIEVMQSGTVSVTVTDASGCMGMAEVTVEALPNPEAQINGSTTFCSGTSTNLDAGNGFEQYLWSDGSMEQTISVNTPGDVGLTVTDANGCMGTTQVSITEADELMPTISGDLSFCENTSTTLNAGTFDTYLWSTGEDTQQIEVTQGGTVSVTVTDATGCMGMAEVTVEVLPEPDVQISGLAAFCAGTSTMLDAGSFDSYLWSTGDDTQEIEVSMVGIVSVTVTDGAGCMGIAEVTVEELPNPVVQVNGSTTFCPGTSTTLDAGADFDQYLWSDGSMEQTISISTPGDVGLTVTDANGCMGATQITVTESDELMPSISGDLSFCENTSTTLNAGAFDTYLWSTGEDTQQIEVMEAGTVSVTVTDASGCMGMAEVTVEVLPNPEVQIDGVAAFCAGMSTLLDAGSFDTYLWSTGDDTQQTEVSQAGMVTVTVTDANGCVGMAEVTVEELPNPDVQISGSTTFCPGASTILDAGAGFDQYMWSDGSMEQTISINTPGDVGLTVTDANGCMGTTQISVTESDELMPVISGDLSFCENNSTILDAGVFDTYMWSTGDDTQQIEVAQSGTVSVTVTDVTGCMGTAQVDIEENPNPEAQISGSTTFCMGTSTTLDGGAGFEQYLWSDGSMEQTIDVDTPGDVSLTITDANGCMGTTQITVTEADELMPSISGDLSFCESTSTTLDAGVFDSYMWSTGDDTQQIEVVQEGTVSVTVTDAAGCMGSAEVTVEVLPNPEAQISGSPTFCMGSATTLDGGAGFEQYLWSDGSMEQTISISTPGDVGLTVTDANGCMGATQINVTEADELMPTISGDLSFCESNTTSLDAGVFDSYMWSTGDDTQQVEISQSGNVSVTVTDAAGCSGTAEVSIQELPAPNVQISGDTSFCLGDTITLDAGTAFESYLWSDGSMGQTLRVNTTGNIGLTVTDANGCEGMTQVAVTEAMAPVALSDDFTLSESEDRTQDYDLLLNDQFNTLSEVTVKLLTAPQAGSLTDQGGGIVTYTAPPGGFGTISFEYELCLTDCPDLCSEATVTIIVEGTDAMVPNGITPNDDGVNDTFVFDIIALNPASLFPDNQLIIFNRWGDIVFRQYEYDNSWNGVNENGEDLPEGTYYYLLYLNIGEGIILRGDVTIVR